MRFTPAARGRLRRADNIRNGPARPDPLGRDGSAYAQCSGSHQRTKTSLVVIVRGESGTRNGLPFTVAPRSPRFSGNSQCSRHRGSTGSSPHATTIHDQPNPNRSTTMHPLLQDPPAAEKSSLCSECLSPKPLKWNLTAICSSCLRRCHCRVSLWKDLRTLCGKSKSHQKGFTGEIAHSLRP